MLIFICFIVTAQAYVFSWMIPEYHLISSKTASLHQELETGYWYILVLAIILIAVVFAIKLITSKNKAPNEQEALQKIN
jgi:lactate permease